MEQRRRYNWLFIIQDQNAEYRFRKYKQDHPKVKSENRLARSFVKKEKLPLFFCYEKGFEEPVSEYLARSAFNWIED